MQLKWQKMNSKINLQIKLTPETLQVEIDGKHCSLAMIQKQLYHVKSKNNKFINNPTEKANELKLFYYSQTLLNDSNNPVPNLTQSGQTLGSVIVKLDEVRSILKSLVTGKASGRDLLNNKILKELAEVKAFY